MSDSLTNVWWNSEMSDECIAGTEDYCYEVYDGSLTDGEMCVYGENLGSTDEYHEGWGNENRMVRCVMPECQSAPTQCYIDDEVLNQSDNVGGLPGVCLGSVQGEPPSFDPNDGLAGLIAAGWGGLLIQTPYYCGYTTPQASYCTTTSDCPGYSDNDGGEG